MKRSPLSAGSGGAGSVLRIRLGGKFTPGVIAILVLHAVTYISLQLPGVGSFLAQTMLLWPAQALGARPYQLLTAPLFMTSILALGFVALDADGDGDDDLYGARVIVDGLAFGVLPEVAAREHQRLKLVALVHHPLGLESGLDGLVSQLLLATEREALAQYPEPPLAKALATACDEATGRVFVEWLIRIKTQEGTFLRLEEVAVQRWAADRIVEERFYYQGMVDEGDDD